MIDDDESNPESEIEFTESGVNPRFDAIGMRRPGTGGEVIIDAMAGRTSVFGFGFKPLVETFRSATTCLQGDSAAWIDAASEDIDDEHAKGGSPSQADALKQRICDLFSGTSQISADHLLLRPSADAAIDSALGMVRRRRPEKAFRIIAVVGSDHGRTGMCRSASGQPPLHDGYGPMMAGFSHAPAGDPNALQACVDEQTAGVLISPVELANGAIACQADYLRAVRDICNQNDLLLMIDETQLVLGASGKWLTYAALADISADIAVVSAGLFGGLPGGLVLANSKFSVRPSADLTRFPLQAAIAEKTLAEMDSHGLPAVDAQSAHPLAVAIAQTLSGFEFIRDIHATGNTIGIETDLDSNEIYRAAQRQGLHLARSGATAVCLQPPLVVGDEDQHLLLDRLGQTMEVLERESAELAI